MQNKSSQIQQFLFKASTVAFPITMIFYSGSAYALQINVATMLNNLSTAVPSLMQLLTATAYVMGMFFIISGIAGLKEFGESRTARSDHRALSGPLVKILVGTALLYLPSSVQVGMSTFWNNPSPFAYVTDATNDSWSELINSVFLILQLIGTLAFIRGLVILSHLGQSHSQGGFGRAMAHIVGGILLINMYQFLQAVFNTLAIGQ